MKPSRRQAQQRWVMTFADLMMLLSTFFILLLSYSEIDSNKYRQIVMSLQIAFQESWGKLSPDDLARMDVVVRPPQSEQIIEPPIPAEPEPEPAPPEPKTPPYLDILESHLSDLTADGLIEIEEQFGQAVISFQHEAAFESGSEELFPQFLPVINRIADELENSEGIIVVEGHTDNVPIQTERFYSNWELSSARAASVVGRMLEEANIPRERIVVIGYADTRPVADNATAEGRAQNRRVEIRLTNEALISEVVNERLSNPPAQP